MLVVHACRICSLLLVFVLMYVSGVVRVLLFVCLLQARVWCAQNIFLGLREKTMRHLQQWFHFGVPILFRHVMFV